MPDEYFDVVDEHDQPTGELVEYKVAHGQGILHRLIAVFVFDKQGRLYVQHHWSGLLDHSVGGHVDAGEDYLTAALREAREELGLVDEKLEELCTGLYSDELTLTGKPMKHIFAIYECHPSNAWKFVPNEEVKEIFAETLETIVDQMNKTPGHFTLGFINTMNKYLQLRQLPYKLDMLNIRHNWSKTH